VFLWHRTIVVSVVVMLCAFMYVQSPGSFISTAGWWLTGMEVDAGQDLIATQWKGNGLQSVSSTIQYSNL